jgi:hypothetical protein
MSATGAVEDKTHVQLSLPRDTDLWAQGKGQPAEILKNGFAEDDKHFRIARVPLARCEDQALDDDEKVFLDEDK